MSDGARDQKLETVAAGIAYTASQIAAYFRGDWKPDPLMSMMGGSDFPMESNLDHIERMVALLREKG